MMQKRAQGGLVAAFIGKRVTTLPVQIFSGCDRWRRGSKLN
ncbi:hypothetical protein LCGC14_1301860 [marine sediment metagenome]|uniref:Uncharacterized protein n=1 Tax=marine sediment metagenome TaxID=412755 RepID=A0A0F9LA03_9ZZZZ